MINWAKGKNDIRKEVDIIKKECVKIQFHLENDRPDETKEQSNHMNMIPNHLNQHYLQNYQTPNSPFSMQCQAHHKITNLKLCKLI